MLGSAEQNPTRTRLQDKKVITKVLLKMRALDFLIGDGVNINV